MRKRVLMSAGLVLLLAAAQVRADATVETLMKSGGFKGMGAFEGTSVTRIQGLKMSESNATKFTGAILSLLPGGGEQITIHRIDKGVIWEIDTKKKSYRENRIEPFKTVESGGTDVGKPTVRVTRSEFKVKKTGGSETINAFPCEEYLLSWLFEVENLETKTKTENTMVTNLWTTPETAAIRKYQAEQSAFSDAYMKKIGLNLPPAEMKQFGMEAIASLSGASRREMDAEIARFKSEMAKIKGYPIRTIVNWKTSGAEVPKPEGTEVREKQGPAGGLGDLIGGLKGVISKKLAGGEQKTAGEGSFFSSAMEVKAIHAESIPADTFEIPPGYVKD